MQTSTDLLQLARLIAERNATERAIAALVGRPALLGHLGECIAAAVFDIELAPSAANRGYDGRFRSGVRAGRSVNVKWYSRDERLLDIAVDPEPDDYLVLTGPRVRASAGLARPWVIVSVYLFASADLHDVLATRKVGAATSLPAALWGAAEIYPTPVHAGLILTTQQRETLALFGPDARTHAAASQG